MGRVAELQAAFLADAERDPRNRLDRMARLFAAAVAEEEAHEAAVKAAASKARGGKKDEE